MAFLVMHPVGFEVHMIECLRAEIAALPERSAELYVGSDPRYPKSPFPFFRITPRNSQSAPIQGMIADYQGIDFTVGRGTGGEIPIGRADHFLRICRAVFTTRFSEVVVYSRRGRVIWSRVILKIDGHKVGIGGGQIFWWLFPKRVTKVFSYEPY
jgi:hypothetical protein